MEKKRAEKFRKQSENHVSALARNGTLTCSEVPFKTARHGKTHWESRSKCWRLYQYKEQWWKMFSVARKQNTNRVSEWDICSVTKWMFPQIAPVLASEVTDGMSCVWAVKWESVWSLTGSLSPTYTTSFSLMRVSQFTCILVLNTGW